MKIKHTYINLMLGCVVALSLLGCTKEEDPEDYGPYTIEGTLYSYDGVTPVPHKKLQLVADLGSNGGGGSIYEWPASTTTDENGNYKLEYAYNRKYNSIDIGQPANEHPVLGPFLQNIPANQNINRDICLSVKNKLHLNVDLKRELSETDTLFVWNLDLIATNDTLYRYNIVNDPAPIYIYIYTKDKVLENNSWIVNLGSHNNYSPEDYSVRWGLGRENFEKSLTLTLYGNSNDPKYNVIKYPLKSFPEISEATITVY